jgi:hypothetical protein
MLADALDAGVRVGWFAADSGYGRDPYIRALLRERAVRFVVEVPVDFPLTDVYGQLTSARARHRVAQHRVLNGRPSAAGPRKAGFTPQGVEMVWVACIGLAAVTIEAVNPYLALRSRELEDDLPVLTDEFGIGLCRTEIRFRHLACGSS